MSRYKRTYYEDNRDRIVAESTKWNKDNPEKRAEIDRRARLKRIYGMTLEDYEELLSSQGGVCAICGRVTERFNVDHDHVTRRVRGILCPNCNKALGLLKDSVDVCRRAGDYLAASKETSLV